jgi:hypothetical protein
MLVAIVVAATFAAVATFATVAAPEAGAADNGSWSVFPSSVPGDNGQVRGDFNLDLRPGLTVDDSVAIANKTSAPLTFRIYAADGINLKTGAFGLKSPDKPSTDIGSWIKLPGTQLTVPARSLVNLPFQIQVPQNATPGDHAGGIVAVNTAASSQQSENGGGARGNIDVLQSVGTRVYGRVAGPLEPSLKITDMGVSTETSVGSMFGTPTDATVTYTIENTGNTRLTPTAQAKVSSLFGLASKDAPEQKLPELLPGSRVSLSQKVRDVLPWFRVKATVDVAEGKVHASGTATTLAIPWLTVLVIFLLIALFVVLRRRRRRRSPQAGTPPEKTEKEVAAAR